MNLAQIIWVGDFNLQAMMINLRWAIKEAIMVLINERYPIVFRTVVRKDFIYVLCSSYSYGRLFHLRLRLRIKFYLKS